LFDHALLKGRLLMATDPEPGMDEFTPQTLPLLVEPVSFKPRLWTVFVAYLIVVVTIVAAQIVMGIALAIWYAAQEWNVQRLQQELPKLLASPVSLMLMGSVTQIIIGLGAVLPAWFSPEPFRTRLGLTRPVLPGWGYPVVVLGTLFPFAVGVGLAVLLTRIMAPNPLVGQLYRQMTWAVAVPFILFIAIAPGVTEELFFRGYMQRRLLERWPPWLAIAVCSLLFAILHVDPHHIVFAFPLGLWLGLVAWRTGAVWPSMLCHAFINGGWNIFQINSVLRGWPDSVGLAVVGTSAMVGLGCALASLWIMGRTRTQEPSAPA
jgi:membrane protease YdiL (CAAX protease family)